MKYGLIGKTLKHSYSKIIHEMFGEYSYELVSVEEKEIAKLLENEAFGGFNVTIPYKKIIMPYCDEISDRAKKIGSVNTVVKKNGKLLGYNTDYAGFLAMANRAKITFNGKKVAILGSGGTYNTAFAVVKDNGAREIVSVSRSGEFNYKNIEKWNDCEIIINTTPVGMYPDNGNSVLNLDDFKNCQGVIDVVYNPLKTKLVFEAQKRGIKATGGLYMLVFQAKEAFELFVGKKLTEKDVDLVFEKLKNDMTNIVFIGMPGSGKSTAGKYYAEKSKKELLDLDALIEEKAKMSIPEIFERFGEERFRDLESERVKEIGVKTGAVISCGGGIIKRKENLYPLAQNGKIVWIKRDVRSLETSGRPLSKDITALLKMEKERTPMYREFADLIIENDGGIDELFAKLEKSL